MMTLSIKECVRFGWQTFKARPWVFVAAGVIVFLINALTGVPESALNYASQQPGGAMATFGLYSLILGILSFIVSLFVQMGTVHFTLKAHDAVESASIADLWFPKPFWRYLVASALVGIAVFVGFLLLIVPGIFLAVALSLVSYLVIDKDLGPIEAVKESWRATKGNRLKLFGLSLTLLGLNILGLLAFVVGLIVTIPVSLIAYAHAYRTLEQAELPLPEPTPVA